MAGNDILKSAYTVEMQIRNIFYISYLVPIGRMRSAVPQVLPLAEVADGQVFLSAVFMNCNEVGWGLVPYPRFNYEQVNLRIYVTDPETEEHAVYFFDSGVSSAQIARLTRLIGIPWQRITCNIDMERDERLQNVSYRVSGEWRGDFSLTGSASSAREISLAPFADTGSMVAYLVQPLIGFIGDKDRLMRFTIWHPSVVPMAGEVEQLDFARLRALGLVDKDKMEKPDNVLFVPEAEFKIYLPPKRVGDAV